MQLIPPHLLAVQVLLGLAAGAAVSLPARDASPEPVPVQEVENLLLLSRHTVEPNIKFTTGTLARDIDSREANPDSNQPPNPNTLTKRLTYNGNASPGQDYYCVEPAGVTETFDSTAPLAADCLAIRAKYAEPVKGYWTISTADQASAPGGWVTLAQQGTCAFKVRLEDGQSARDYRIGSNDVWFFTGYARSSRGGRYQGISNVLCNWSGSQSVIRWGIVRP